MSKILSIVFGALGIISLLCSFFMHSYFLQFLILGIFLLCICMTTYNKQEIDELKKIIQEHNELIKKDIEEMKKR